MSITLHLGAADVSDREHLAVGGFDAWWRRDFEDVPGARPVTNVVVQGDGFYACGCAYDHESAVAQILSTTVALS